MITLNFKTLWRYSVEIFTASPLANWRRVREIRQELDAYAIENKVYGEKRDRIKFAINVVLWQLTLMVIPLYIIGLIVWLM